MLEWLKELIPPFLVMPVGMTIFAGIICLLAALEKKQLRKESRST